MSENVENVGYLLTAKKKECFGCEACAQVCPVSAITMTEDDEGFRYPVIDKEKCIGCDRCKKVCPAENPPLRPDDEKTAFGGHHKDAGVLGESTSGGAFSAIVDGWCDENYVIFGAETDGLRVFHSYISDKSELSKFRRSKYLQSKIGTAYRDAAKFLKKGKKVLFSGTPCQIAGLKGYLGNASTEKLLTVEVICEGVPTPHYMARYEEYLKKKYRSEVKSLDYRYKDINLSKNPVSGKWDFQVMHTVLENDKKIKKDRWFNPFWSIWLKHLMTRPSCYECPFATQSRVADVTLGDLWGVHLYCPELYNRNAGASLIVCNTEAGKKALEAVKPFLVGHELKFSDALKYQSPMRKHINVNDDRAEFMRDVKVMDYRALCKKWADRSSCKLLWQKYIWGNRQKVWLWNLKNRRDK